MTRQKKVVWLDVGTHRGQEFRSIFSSDLRILSRLLKHVRKREAGVSFKEALAYAHTVWHGRKALKARRASVYAVMVEANPFILSQPVYADADAVFALALGQRNASDLSFGKLFLVDADIGGQGSSIYETKPNIAQSDFVPCVVMDPDVFVESLKSLLSDFEWDYDVILRINCEGAEDEVIYAAHKAFGTRLVHVFGSLKDVEGVKGEAAYRALMDFMRAEDLPFTYFSSETSSWLDSHAELAKILAKT